MWRKFNLFPENLDVTVVLFERPPTSVTVTLRQKWGGDFASTVAIKVGAFSTIRRSSWQPGFFASLFFGLKTPHPWTASPQFESHSATTHCVADGSPLAANRTAHSTLVLPLWWSGIEAIVRKCETRLPRHFPLC